MEASEDAISGLKSKQREAERWLNINWMINRRLNLLINHRLETRFLVASKRFFYFQFHVDVLRSNKHLLHSESKALQDSGSRAIKLHRSIRLDFLGFSFPCRFRPVKFSLFRGGILPQSWAHTEDVKWVSFMLIITRNSLWKFPATAAGLEYIFAQKFITEIPRTIRTSASSSSWQLPSPRNH